MQFQENFSLKEFNTFGIDVRARYFSGFSSVEIFAELLNFKPDHDKLILGGGSNVLFTGDVNGLVLKKRLTTPLLSLNLTMILTNYSTISTTSYPA